MNGSSSSLFEKNFVKPWPARLVLIVGVSPVNLGRDLCADFPDGGCFDGRNEDPRAGWPGQITTTTRENDCQ